MSTRRAVRRGTILFEVVVGMTILAIAGIGWVSLMAQTRASIAKVRNREARVRVANDLLQRYQFLTPAELDAHLGSTQSGPVIMSVSNTAPHLYSLVVQDTGSQAILLSTTVYARDTTDTMH